MMGVMTVCVMHNETEARWMKFCQAWTCQVVTLAGPKCPASGRPSAVKLPRCSTLNQLGTATVSLRIKNHAVCISDLSDTRVNARCLDALLRSLGASTK